MSSISLSFYEISVKKRREKELFDLTDFEGTNILDVFESLIKSLNRRTFIYKPNKQALSIYHDKDDEKAKIFYRKGQFFSCLLCKGDYGSITPIVNTSLDDISYTKKIDDADMIPLYFGSKIRSGYKKGVIAFQGIGTNSAKSLFQIALKEHMENNHNDFIVSLESVVPDKLIEELIENGFVQSFRFIKNTIPTDKVNFLDREISPLDGSAEFIIKMKEKSPYFKKKLKKAVKNDGLGFVTIKDFIPDETKVEVKVGKKTKVINIDALKKISGRIDISDEVDLNNKGIPRFEDVDENAVDFLNAISKNLN